MRQNSLITVLLALALLGCSTNKVVPEDRNEIAYILSQDYYPNGLNSAQLKVLAEDEAQINIIRNELSTYLPSSTLEGKVIINSNLNKLEELIGDIRNRILVEKYRNLLSMQYLMDNRIDGTDPTSIDIYLVLNREKSLRAEIQQKMENYLLEKDPVSSNDHVMSNLSFISSMEQFDSEIINEMPATIPLQKLDGIEFGADFTISGNVVNAHFYFTNQSRFSTYIVLSDPQLLLVPTRTYDRFDQYKTRELRFIKEGDTKEINYSFIIQSRAPFKNLSFSIKLNNKGYTFPLAVPVSQ